MGQAQDAMVSRLENELNERLALVNGLTAQAQDEERDLNDVEKRSIESARERMVQIQGQLETIEQTAKIAEQIAERSQRLDAAISTARRNGGPGPVEYRSAGHYLLDVWRMGIGERDARDRLDVYGRAAAHQKTSDNLGIVPDPIVGPVVNFIDSTRPIVTQIGTQPLLHGTWYRPKVTQHASVAVQGAAGAAADEKTELVSQKMTITRITGTAKTYGGYVNVSRQDIDFSSPSALDTVVNDLAAQYSIQTEAAMATALTAVTGTSVEVAGVNTASHTAGDLMTALFTALATVYNVARGAGRYYVACSPDKVGVWAPLFSPVNVNPAAPALGSAGAQFGNGVFGNVAGVPLIVSAGLPAGTIGIVTTTAAFEAFEQRVGVLSITEPSVLGVQVAYAGYFTPVTIDATAGCKIIDAT